MIDYSPLEKKTPVAVQHPDTDIPAFSNTFGATLVTLFIVTITGIFIVPILLSPLIYKKVKKFIEKSGYSAIRLSNFAIGNGFKYQYGISSNGEAKKIQFGGIIGSEKQGIVASNIISGQYKDIKFSLFNPYLEGLYTIMKIELANEYPHIVLDSLSNNPFVSNIGHFFNNDSRISLEGDFDKFFRVYSKAPAVDTLRILSPDMMKIMIDTGHKYDIEIVENHLHIISNYKFSDVNSVKYFFDLADNLMDKLDRRVATKQATFDTTRLK